MSPGVNAASMLVELRKRVAGVKDAVVVVINPPPVQGLGAAGGFKLMLEDRGGLGPQALADAARALVAAANKDKVFGGVFTLYNAGAPSVYADIDRLKARKNRSHANGCVFHDGPLPWLAVRERLQLHGPHVSGTGSGR